MSVTQRSEAGSETTSGREAREKLVKVSVEVRSGAARFRVDVQAESIREALRLVGSRYPQGDIRIHFPIEPEGFFVRGPTAQSRKVGPEQIHQEAA